MASWLHGDMERSIRLKMAGCCDVCEKSVHKKNADGGCGCNAETLRAVEQGNAVAKHAGSGDYKQKANKVETETPETEESQNSNVASGNVASSNGADVVCGDKLTPGQRRALETLMVVQDEELYGTKGTEGCMDGEASLVEPEALDDDVNEADIPRESVMSDEVKTSGWRGGRWANRAKRGLR